MIAALRASFAEQTSLWIISGVATPVGRGEIYPDDDRAIHGVGVSAGPGAVGGYYNELAREESFHDDGGPLFPSLLRRRIYSGQSAYYAKL